MAAAPIPPAILDLHTVENLWFITWNLPEDDPDALLYRGMMINAFNQHAHELNVDPWPADKAMAEVLQELESMIEAERNGPPGQSQWAGVIHTLSEIYGQHLAAEIVAAEGALPGVGPFFAAGAGLGDPAPIIIDSDSESDDSMELG